MIFCKMSPMYWVIFCKMSSMYWLICCQIKICMIKNGVDWMLGKDCTCNVQCCMCARIDRSWLIYEHTLKHTHTHTHTRINASRSDASCMNKGVCYTHKWVRIKPKKKEKKTEKGNKSHWMIACTYTRTHAKIHMHTYKHTLSHTRYLQKAC